MKNKTLKIIIAVTVLLIWLQSAMPRDLSSAESSFVTRLIEPVIAFFIGKENVTEHLVRKLAHFSEYTLLGFELGILCRREEKKPFHAPAAGAAIAFLDETIQIFSGRGPAIADVWLDISGTVTGLAVWLILSAIISRIHNKKKNRKQD